MNKEEKASGFVPRVLINNKKSDSKGRILRLKKGYNPNSSSVGSQIPYFLSFAAGTGLVSIVVFNIISSYDKLIRKKKDKDSNSQCSDSKL